MVSDGSVAAGCGREAEGDADEVAGGLETHTADLRCLLRLRVLVDGVEHEEAAPVFVAQLLELGVSRFGSDIAAGRRSATRSGLDIRVPMTARCRGARVAPTSID